MRGRRRHGRPHFKRQGIFLQPGGSLLVESPSQSTGQQDGTDGQQQASAPILHHDDAPEQPQTHLHSPSAAPTDSLFLSTILFGPTSLQNVAQETSTVSSFLSTSSSKPINHAPQSGSASSRFSTVTTKALGSSSASVTPTPSASQSSVAAASPTPHVDATGHSIEFYGGIVFVSIVAVACLISFVAWLIRSRRTGRMCCGGGREGEDVENQDLGHGLGLYLDKPANGFDSPKLSSTPLPSSTTQTNLLAPPTFQSLGNIPGRYPSISLRPPAAHVPTSDTVQSQSRLLGPLQIKNYISGDFPSSCDEAPTSPKLGAFRSSELSAPRPMVPNAMPRFLGPEGHIQTVPWPPLNIRSSRAPSQVSITHSTSKKGAAAQAEDDEKIPPLPMPPFDFGLAKRDDESGSPVGDGWGATLRSSIYNALSGLSGNVANTEEGNLITSRSHSGRWQDVQSSLRPGNAEMPYSVSHAGNVYNVPTSHSTVMPGGLSEPQPEREVPNCRFDALAIRLQEQDTSIRPMRASNSTPLIAAKKRASKCRSKPRSESVKSQSLSRASSFYSPCPDAFRHSSSSTGKRTPKGLKRGSLLAQSSSIARRRPEFLRRPTSDSITSFSSESSEPSRGLTDEELRVQRMMMIRARKKRGMGSGSGAGRRPTISTTLSRRQTSAAVPGS